jgi:hypothetical protein
MAAESVSRVDDVEIVTLRKIALDSVDVPGLRPVDAPDASSDIRVETPQEFLLDPEICAVPSLPANELGARREALSIPIAYHICQRIFFAMRVAEPSSMQRDEESDIPPPEAFAQELAIDHLIVSKTSSEKEFAVLVVREGYSGVIQAYPSAAKDSLVAQECLLKFVA